MSSLKVTSLKERGDREFKRQKYGRAIESYTQALDRVDAAIPIEAHRILLANRAQAFILCGVIHEALRDLNHALSPQCTDQDSPKILTAKCCYRRARVLCTMARYDEAQADYREFANIMGEIGTEISSEELKLKEGLDRRAAAGDNSEQGQRDGLMRAIDARGFILWEDSRVTSLIPTQDVREAFAQDPEPESFESMKVSFDTLDSKPDYDLADPNLTPILIPVTIRVPYYFHNPNSFIPFSTHEENPLSENEAIGSFIDGVFTSIATSSHHPVIRASLPSAMANGRDRVLIMISSRGRIFKISREMTIKDVVAGARWPRQSNVRTFEDLRRTPRKRSDEMDGIELLMNRQMIEVWVVTNDKLGELIDRLETASEQLGL